MSKIQFHFLTEPFHFANRTKLKKFILDSLRTEGRAVEYINFIFCTDSYLLSLNQGYLGHDTYTDIITFELSPKGHPILSDIYISVERVRENAKQFKTSFGRELHRVIFHGTLHLMGLKDKTNAQAAVMRESEEKYLSAYFVPRETKGLKD